MFDRCLLFQIAFLFLTYFNRSILRIVDPPPQPSKSPRQCDDEEAIRVDHGLKASQLRDLVRRGAMNCPSSLAVLLALDRLGEMNLLDQTQP